MTTIYGQIIVGPPGSGKSTYCKYIGENLRQIGRHVKIINLDPANDNLPYKAYADISSFVNVPSVMESLDIGPNNAFLKCIECLDKHYGWLHDVVTSSIKEEEKQWEKLKKQMLEDGKDVDANNIKLEHRPYLLFDCPGQSELFTHHTALRSIIKKMTTKNSHFDLRLACVNLCDAHHVSDLHKYIGTLTNSALTMLNLELPHINVLSKIDLIGQTRFNIEFYTEVLDLKYLLDMYEDDPFHARHRVLTEKLIDVIQDYGLVTFLPLNISKPEDIYTVLKQIDIANGYCIDDLDLAILQMNPQLLEMASGRRLNQQV